MSDRYGGVAAVLMLHRVTDEIVPGFAPRRALTVRPGFLDDMLAGLAERGFEFVSMDGLADTLRSDRAPAGRRKIAITLDDGYRDNLEQAAPIFERHQAPYTIYVVPGFVDGMAEQWADDLEVIVANANNVIYRSGSLGAVHETRTPAQKNRVFRHLAGLMFAQINAGGEPANMRRLAAASGVDLERERARRLMSWDDLRFLARDPLCTIGAHTMTHRSLAHLPEAEAVFEIAESARRIEFELGRRPRHFAYPYGAAENAADREFRLTADAGFETAVTTRSGVIVPDHRDQLTALPRIMVDGRYEDLNVLDAQLSGLPGRLRALGRYARIA